MTGVSTPCGDKVLRLVDSSTTLSAGLFSAYAPVTSGNSYTAEAYIQRTDTNLNGASIYLKYYNSTNGEIGSFSRASSGEAGAWSYVSVAGTAPAGAVKARVLCYSYSTSTGTMYFDGVSLRPTASASPPGEVAWHVSPSGTGNGYESYSPAKYNDPVFWDAVREGLGINPIKVVFHSGEYLINTDADRLMITNTGNATNSLTLEGARPYGTVFTRNNQAQTASPTDPTASGRLQMVLLKWVTNVVVRNLHWESDTTQANKLAGYSIAVQSGSTGAETTNVVIEGCSFVGLGQHYYGATGFHHAKTRSGKLLDCEFIGRGYDSHYHFSYNSYGAYDLRFERNYFEDCSGPYLRLRAGCHDAVLINNEFVSTAGTNNWPFIEMATFNDVDPGDETWGYNHFFTNNTFNFVAAGTPSGIPASVPFRFVHAGFDPYRSPGVTWKYLLTTNYAAVLSFGTPSEKRALLRVNYGVNYGRQFYIGANTFTGFHSYLVELYSYSVPGWNYTNSAGAHICPDYGGDGRYDISDILEAPANPTTNWWIADANGSWTGSTNWEPAGVPSEAGSVALVTNNITAARTNTVDWLVAVGELEVGSRNGAARFVLNAASDGSITFDHNGLGARLTQRAGNSLDTIYTPLYLADDLTLSNSTTLTIGSVISELGGPRSLTKYGSGQLTLGSSNTFSGGLNIRAGAVAVGTATKLGQGAVRLGDTTGTNSASIIGSRTVTNPIIVEAGSTGAKTLRCSGSSTIRFSGPITLEGDLTASSFNTGGSTTLSGPISGPGVITVTAQNPTNVVVLGGTNSFSGGVTVSSGTLLLGNDAAAGGGPVEVSNGTTMASGNNGAITLSNAVTLSGNITLGQAIGGTGALTLAGPIQLGGATRTVSVSNALATLSGSVSGSAGLIKSGVGTLVLNGTNSYAGGTTVGQGRLIVNGRTSNGAVTVGSGGTLGGNGSIGGIVTVASGGTFSPGSDDIASLEITNKLILQTGSTALIQINKSAGTSDRVTGIGTLSYGGTLVVTNTGGEFAGGEVYQLFDFGLFNGKFSATNLPALNAGLTWVWQPSTGTLRVDGGIAQAPTNIVFRLTDDVVELSWPASHLGWYVQSNSVNLSDPDSWFDVEGSQGATNLNLRTEAGLEKVFYRLRRPW